MGGGRRAEARPSGWLRWHEKKLKMKIMTALTGKRENGGKGGCKIGKRGLNRGWWQVCRRLSVGMVCVCVCVLDFQLLFHAFYFFVLFCFVYEKKLHKVYIVCV